MLALLYIVHYKADGRSLHQHEQILQKFTTLLNTYEDLFMPEDRNNLLHIDFANVAEGPTIDQERWVANIMNPVLAARRIQRARQGRRIIRLPLESEDQAMFSHFCFEHLDI